MSLIGLKMSLILRTILIETLYVGKRSHEVISDLSNVIKNIKSPTISLSAVF